MGANYSLVSFEIGTNYLHKKSEKTRRVSCFGYKRDLYEMRRTSSREKLEISEEIQEKENQCLFVPYSTLEEK